MGDITRQIRDIPHPLNGTDAFLSVTSVSIAHLNPTDMLAFVCQASPKFPHHSTNWLP
jgi:hypothetical protein